MKKFKRLYVPVILLMLFSIGCEGPNNGEKDISLISLQYYSEKLNETQNSPILVQEVLAPFYKEIEHILQNDKSIKLSATDFFTSNYPIAVFEHNIYISEDITIKVWSFIVDLEIGEGGISKVFAQIISKNRVQSVYELDSFVQTGSTVYKSTDVHSENNIIAISANAFGPEAAYLVLTPFYYLDGRLDKKAFKEESWEDFHMSTYDGTYYITVPGAENYLVKQGDNKIYIEASDVRGTLIKNICLSM